MSTEINLSRWKLYAKVWETPISRLAADLGVSDVGLRKACIRHDIPVPPRGHWARRSAGCKVVEPPLPRPGDDEVVSILPGGKKPRISVTELPTAATASTRFAFRATLDGCLPIVKKTARFFADAKADEERRARRRLAPATRPNWSIEPQLVLRATHPGVLYNGRLNSLGDGRLHIVATLRHVDWILRFHEALLRSLRACGIKIIPRDGEGRAKVQISGYGATLAMSFVEEYERNSKPSRNGEAFEAWLPKDSFKLQFHSPATQSPKLIRGTMAQLEEELPGMAARVVKLLAEEAERERQRLKAAEERAAAEAARKIEMDAWFAERELEHKRQALERQRLAARMAQAGRLMEATKAQAEYLLASDWLGRVEAEAGDDEAVRTWVSVARDGLIEPFAVLLDTIRQEAGQVEKPLWWPEAQNASR